MRSAECRQSGQTVVDLTRGQAFALGWTLGALAVAAGDDAPDAWATLSNRLLRVPTRKGARVVGVRMPRDWAMPAGLVILRALGGALRLPIEGMQRDLIRAAIALIAAGTRDRGGAAWRPTPAMRRAFEVELKRLKTTDQIAPHLLVPGCVVRGPAATTRAVRHLRSLGYKLPAQRVALPRLLSKVRTAADVLLS